MHYNFKRLSGKEWHNLIHTLRRRGVGFLELEPGEIYDASKTSNIFKAYYYKTTSSCKLVYYDYDNNKVRKKLREISFSPKEIDVLKCVFTFRHIASEQGELLGYDPSPVFSNGVYTYFSRGYKGYVTVLDMNSAYLYALKQPLADWQTRTECTMEDVSKRKFDYYSFENDLHKEMVYKLNNNRLYSCMLWADVKIYGYKASVHYEKTADELYRLKCEVDKDKYKNVANIAIGCMHKRSGQQNNATLAASLYAWFDWKIDSLVDLFQEKGYNVIMVTTDSIKIKGKYNFADNLVPIGNGLGEFKLEYEGEAKYMSVGHYEENKIKWKGKPMYMIEGYPRCEFIDNIDEELEVYEKYAIK